MDKRYARLKRKMLLLVVAGTLAALAVGMLLLHTVVDGVLQDPFARAFLWVAQNLFGQDEAAALELYQQTVRNQKPGLLALGTIVLMLVAFYLALGRFTTWLDQIGAAVRQVVSESGQPVVLPKELAPVAEDLNAIERGRSLDSVISQYLNTVKPMHQQFVQPSRQYADIVVLDGGHNLVALDMITQRIKSHVDGG